MPEEQKPAPVEQPKKSRLRKDLLTTTEAKEEFHRRLTNVIPDLPALIVVVIMGGIGAAVASWWHLSIGEAEFAAAAASLPVLLQIFLGSLGATAAVFLLAKTDTSKLIHCGLIAVLSGMAGPYLVTKALSTVISVKPEQVRVGGIAVVKSSTDKLRKEIENQTSNTNPQKIVDVVDQTAQATSSYLAALKEAPKDQKQRDLAGTKQQLQETLTVLNTAAAVVPKQSLPLISNVLKQAQEAGATDVAQEAQKIIDTNPAVQAAVKNAELSGKVFFIAPQRLTDVALQGLHARIKERFPLADIQPAVHPTRQMDPGLEVVYYRNQPLDQQNATILTKLVADYFQEQKVGVASPKVRQGSTDQVPPPLQFDIHIGPDIASKLIEGR